MYVKLITWQVSVVALEASVQIYVCLLRCFCGLFQGSIDRLYIIDYIDSLKIYGSKKKIIFFFIF